MKSSGRILNLDDNAAARYLKTRALQSAGFEVIEAGCGLDALRIAGEQRFDIALLDVKLPDISGLEVCRSLKANPSTSDIPVVQISATHVTDSDAAAGFEHGADIYLTEPIEAIVLVTVMRTLLRLRCTESGLLASEEKFKAIVNQATAGIVQLDLDGRFTHANLRFCELVERAADELYALGIVDITHPGDVEEGRALFTRMVDSGESFHAEMRYVRPDASVLWASNSVSLIRNKRGVAQHAIAIVVDITERKRAEEREHFLVEVSERLAELTDQASTLQKVTGAVVPAIADWCAVDLLDVDGTRKRVASSPADVLASQGLMQPTGDAVAPALVPPSTTERVFRTRQAELVKSVAETALHADPEDDRWLQELLRFGLRSCICVPLVLRDKNLGTLVMGTGVSGRRYQESDLLLAAEIGRRVSIAVENANLYQAIRRSARRKDEFLATLAHELRNPLAPLRSSLELVRMAPDRSDALEKAYGVMERQVSQLRRLVDDLLDVSRINTGKIELRRERIELSELVNHAVEAVRVAIESEHALAISLPPREIQLYVDPTRVAQVLTNLLDNARKYTPAGGKVSLIAESRGAEVTIAITDTGIGIAPEMLEKIFDMFVQADNSYEKSHGGLGIGLTLVKRLVEMHGGRVSVASEGAGKGSSFVVRLPTLFSTEGDVDLAFGSSQKGKAASATKARIFVVDDNEDSAGSLAALLEAMGHEVGVANDGAIALRSIIEHRPDIVFLDIGLPGMNGYEVIRHLRKDEAFDKDTYVVALSGYGTPHDIERSKEADFDMHIVKPIDMSVLTAIVGNSNPGMRRTPLR